MKKLLTILLSAIIVFYCSNVTAQTEKNTGNNKGSQKTGNAKEEKNTKGDKTATGKAIVTQNGGGKVSKNIEESSTPIIIEKENGTINYTEQYIEAKGLSVIDNNTFKIPAQARLMAIRGAEVVAQRNLLEIINGVNVTSETKVVDMIAVSDYIYTRVDGVIKGAQRVGEPVEKDGAIEVTLRVPLYANNGLAPAVYNEIPSVKKKSAMQQQGNADTSQVSETQQGNDLFSNIAFNLNGQSYDPSLFPLVVDETGQTVLDFTSIYDPNQGKFPKIMNITKDIFSTFGFSKGTEVIDAVPGANGKLVVNKNKTSKINWGKIGKTAATVGQLLLMVL